MKKLTDQLQSVSKFLVNLSKQVEKISRQIEKHQAAKQASAAKTKTPAKKATAGKAKKDVKPTKVLDSVYNAIKRSRKGISIAKLKETTGLGSRQLSNALHKLSKKGAIEAISRGVYVKK